MHGRRLARGTALDLEHDVVITAYRDHGHALACGMEPNAVMAELLLRGDPAKLDALASSDDWARHMVRAGMHLDSSGYVRAHTGGAVMERMQLWTGAIPE